MSARIHIHTVFIILFLLSEVYSIPQEVSETASKYKGFDELVQDIEEIKFRNKTFYLIKYSKNLVYSGSLVAGPGGEPVTDSETLKAFTAAYIIHETYSKTLSRQWLQYSRHYKSLSDMLYLRGYTLLADDAEQISVLFAECALNMEKVLEDYDPEKALTYIEVEDKLVKALSKACSDSVEVDAGKDLYVRDFRDSVAEMREFVYLMHESLIKSVNYSAENMKSRVFSENNRIYYEIFFTFLGLLVIVVVFLIRFRR